MINTAHPALPSPNPYRIWLVGAGGAGCNIVEHVSHPHALCVAANHEWPGPGKPGVVRLMMPRPLKGVATGTSQGVIALARQWRTAFTEVCHGITSWPEYLHLISGYGGTGLALVRLFIERAPITTTVVLWQVAPFCFENQHHSMSVLEKIIDIRPDIQRQTLTNELGPKQQASQKRDPMSLLDHISLLNERHAAEVIAALPMLS